MTGTQDIDREQIVRKAQLFHSFLSGDAAQREFHRSVIKNGKKFLALIERERVLFILGHYALAPLAQLQQLHQKQTISAAEVQTKLNALCGISLAPGEPLYERVDALYANYCAQATETPSAPLPQTRQRGIVRKEKIRPLARSFPVCL